MKPLDLHLYRQPEIKSTTPYPFAVSPDGWIWEAHGDAYLHGHHVDTAEYKTVRLPVGMAANDVAVLGSRVVICHHEGLAQHDPMTGQTQALEPPGCQMAEPRFVYRSASRLVALNDAHLIVVDDSKTTVHALPFSPTTAVAVSAQNARYLFLFVSAPPRLVLFDVENFDIIDIECPFSDINVSTAFATDQTLFLADTDSGSLVPYHVATNSWGQAIPIPTQGNFDILAQGTAYAGEGLFTLRHDNDSPPRLLRFAPQSRTFEYLNLPEQPDGVPVLHNICSDGERLYATGYIRSFDPMVERGDWCILQSHPAEQEPGFSAYDFAFDREQHLNSHRRCVGPNDSLYIQHWVTPELESHPHALPSYPVGIDQRLKRRATRTNTSAYLKSILSQIVQPNDSAHDITKAILRFAHHATFYSPIRELSDGDQYPVALLESHDIRCGGMATVMTELLSAAGIDSRRAGLNHHVVSEAHFEGSWHICDPLFFGANQPTHDGHWLSVDELKKMPYFVDAMNIESLIFPNEISRSRDDYYVLGYVMGIWGSEPYYSYYLGAPYDAPPTLPHVLPAHRMTDSVVKLRWAESVKRGGGHIDYHISLYTDRQQTNCVFETTTANTSIEWEPPSTDCMYHIAVKAMDDHRQFNPETWYPAARGNFVLAPRGQYGWYGTI